MSKKPINKKNILFWTLNLTGWLVFSMLWLILYGPDRDGLIGILKFFTSNFLIGFTVSIGLRYILKKFHTRGYQIYQIVFVVLTASFFGAAIWYFADILMTHLLYNLDITRWIQTVSGRRIISTIFNLFILICSWSTLYFVINLIFDWQEERYEKEKALVLATEAKMEMLKNQINPHFLFNSLNSISALIIENPAKAQLVVDKLSDFLRFTLSNKGNQTHRLKEEIRVIRHYVQIQEIRFEEKLRVSFQIAPDTEDILVPASILYPIVENAIKHGINTSNPPLEIKISTEIKPGNLLISIKNSGYWIDQEQPAKEGTNTGIKNVQERLICEYGTSAKFETIRGTSQVEVKLTIPIR